MVKEGLRKECSELRCEGMSQVMMMMMMKMMLCLRGDGHAKGEVGVDLVTLKNRKSSVIL